MTLEYGIPSTMTEHYRVQGAATFHRRSLPETTLKYHECLEERYKLQN